MKNKHPEILAPAGSMETLIAALRTGADAVYAGGKKFSARSSAANFTIDELAEAADLCHLYDAKLYLAVNTVISDSEIAEFCEYIKETARIGIDAYIVQDLGCARLIKKCVPDAVLHASTQMSIHTTYGAELADNLGFSRIVPARELDKNTLKKICDTKPETEIFVHGALCMSVSGQCYMSAFIGSRSANRGCCGQACRLPFSACGNKEYAALSLKDLSLIPIISELEEIGADSLKIEGRMKRPEYAAASVNAIHEAFSGNQPDMQLLRGIFSRGGFTDGYFTGNRHDMFGVREKNDVVAAQTLIPGIHELYRSERKVRKLDFHVIVRSDCALKITAHCGNLTVEAISERPETAKNRPVDLEFLKKQLSRLGDTVYSLGEVTAEIEDNLAVPAGRLNEMRRTLTDRMNRLIISQTRPDYKVTGFIPEIRQYSYKARNKLPIRTICRTMEQLIAAYNYSEYIAVPMEILSSGIPDNIDKQRVIICPPRFISNEEQTADILEKLHNAGFSRLLCHTADSIALGKKYGYRLHGGFSLNICNSYSADALEMLGFEDYIASPELKLASIETLSSGLPMGAVVYGKIPLMLTRNCPIKNEVGCGKCRKKITDRTGHTFDVVCHHDYTEILNADTLYMLDRLDKFRSADFGIVMLHDENAARTEKILSVALKPESVTRGLYYRGI